MSSDDAKAIFDKLEKINDRLGKVEVNLASRWSGLLGLGIGLGLVNVVALLKGFL